MVLSLQVYAGPSAQAADSLTINSPEACVQFLEAIGGAGSTTGKTCLVSAASGAGTPTIAAALSVTIASDWTLELSELDAPGGFAIAGTLDVNGAFLVHAGWRSDPAPELAVSGTLHNSGVVHLQDGSLDFVAAHIVNSGRIVNSGSLSGGIVNNGYLLNTRTGTMSLGERRILLENSGELVNRGKLSLGLLWGWTATSTGTITNTATGRLTIGDEAALTLTGKGKLINRGKVVNNGWILLDCGGKVSGTIAGPNPVDACIKVTVARVSVAAGDPNQVRVAWHAGKGLTFDVDYRRYRNAVEQDDFTAWLRPTSSTSGRFTGTPGSTYQFRVRANYGGDSGPWITPVTTTLALDERQAGQFGSGWTERTSTKAYAGTYRVATGSGSTWTVTGSGTTLRIYGTTLKAGGKAHIYVDGKYRKTVSTFSRRTRYRQVLFGVKLPNGQHQLTVVSHATGHRNKLIVDAFVALY